MKSQKLMSFWWISCGKDFKSADGVVTWIQASDKVRSNLMEENRKFTNGILRWHRNEKELARDARDVEAGSCTTVKLNKLTNLRPARVARIAVYWVVTYIEQVTIKLHGREINWWHKHICDGTETESSRSRSPRRTWIIFMPMDSTEIHPVILTWQTSELHKRQRLQSIPSCDRNWTSYTQISWKGDQKMTKGNLRWHGYEKKWLQITSTNLDHRHANAFHENEPHYT